jgi:glutamine amidotransferase
LTVGIVDIGIGNIGSVSNALCIQGWDPLLVSSVEDFKNISHMIIPGVGSYAATMERLHEANLVQPIVDFIQKGNPTLGICLGMQLLSLNGLEGAETDTDGLGLIEGEVMHLEKFPGLSLPHVGWNEVAFKRDHPVLCGVKDRIDFYFVNSFYFNIRNQKDVIASTNYGHNFPSIVGKNNVIGVQFHPEKSQKNGLKILDNFCLWDGKC